MSSTIWISAESQPNIRLYHSCRIPLGVTICRDVNSITEMDVYEYIKIPVDSLVFGLSSAILQDVKERIDNE